MLHHSEKSDLCTVNPIYLWNRNTKLKQTYEFLILLQTVIPGALKSTRYEKMYVTVYTRVHRTQLLCFMFIVRLFKIISWAQQKLSSNSTVSWVLCSLISSSWVLCSLISSSWVICSLISSSWVNVV